MVELAWNHLLSKNLLEHVKRDPWLAYVYAKVVVEGPWLEGEPIILAKGQQAYWYASECLGMKQDKAFAWVKRKRIEYGYEDS